MEASVIVSENDQEKVVDKFNEKCWNRFDSKIERKKSKFEWYSSIDQLSQRFYNHFSFNQIRFFEMRFCSQSKEYRALFYVDEVDENLIFVDVFEKDDYWDSDSKQRMIIEKATSAQQNFRDQMEQKKAL